MPWVCLLIFKYAVYFYKYFDDSLTQLIISFDVFEKNECIYCSMVFATQRLRISHSRFYSKDYIFIEWARPE